MIARMVDLPPAITTRLFDLDGVLTKTAEVHAAAWKATCDDYLREHAARTAEPFEPIRLPDDYAEYAELLRDA